MLVIDYFLYINMYTVIKLFINILIINIFHSPIKDLVRDKNNSISKQLWLFFFFKWLIVYINTSNNLNIITQLGIN